MTDIKHSPETGAAPAGMEQQPALTAEDCKTCGLTYCDCEVCDGSGTVQVLPAEL